MKRVLVGIALLLLIISACSPQAEPTGLPAEDGEPTQITADLTPAEQAAISTLAENIGIEPDQIKLVSSEAVDWPDSCLGIVREGIACAQVITPGFRVILEADGKQVEYHTNQDATVIRPATVALMWQRSGGIAGFCDNLTVYLSGEVHSTSCNTTEVAETRLIDLLSADEIATFNEWISTYGVVEIDASDPKGMADGMSVTLQFFGTGTEQLTTQEAQQVLLQFAQDLSQRLMTR